MTLLAQDHLRTLASIRERCQQVYEQVKRGGDGVCFDIDESKLPDVMDAVAATTERRFVNLNEIPPHSRIRHFDPKQLEKLDKEGWANVDATEKARRLVDLVVVSVLVDAGAGQTWKYKTSDDKLIGRSEGLALASFDMFMNGYFSGVEGSPDRVDGLWEKKKYNYAKD
jgi:hypothetical protein